MRDRIVQEKLSEGCEGDREIETYCRSHKGTYDMIGLDKVG